MKKIITLIFLFICIKSFAQQEAANWYFGYGAGMQFNPVNGTVNSVDNGQLSTNEGCASISDDTGSLLFYTDGTTVWNRNHVVMQNGAGLFGDPSSTQSAIIVPKPEDANIYYIFTVDNNLNGSNFGFNYSEVDMTLDAGSGAVVTKNINLLPLCSEKISAVVKDCITKSIWVITFASQNGNVTPYNSFHAFEVSNTGINTTPVVSTFGINITDARGYLKLSPDGTKLVNANMSDGLFLYDFDVNTGVVSNEQQLFINTQSDKPYGVEFSQNNQFLYIHSSNDYFNQQNQSENSNPANHTSTLTQFDLSAANIQASEFSIDQRQLYRGGLQLAPNGKIYRALSSTYSQGLSFLGVINNPNNLGAGSNYQHNAINLSPNNSSQGLPPFIQSLFNIQIDIIQNGESATNLELCDGDLYTLVSENVPGATYTWTRDNIPLAESDFDLEINQTGHYEVLIDPNNGDCAIEGQAYVTYNNLPAVFDQTLFQCDEDGVPDGFTLFNLTESIDDITNGATNTSVKFYESLNDAENSIDEIDGNSYSNTINPQIVYAQVLNETTRCFDIAELTLEVSATNANDAELIACDDDGTEDGLTTFNLQDAESDVLNGLPNNLDLSYYETYENALLEVSPLSIIYTNTTPYSQTIFVRVENMNACYGINEIELSVLELPDIETEFETIYCLNFFPETIIITGGVNDLPNNYYYSWSTGETTSEIQVNQPGDYTVTVTNIEGCSKLRTVTVLPSNIATIEEIEVTDVTDNNTITVIVSTQSEGDYEYALDDINGPYFDSNIFENVSAGFHTVFVRDKNDCGVVDDLVSVIGFPRFFTPNNDGYNDTWQVEGVNSQFQPNTIIYIFDRYGKLITQLNPLSDGWDGNLNGYPLPSNDYWFAITLQDGRIYKDHFTLKR